MSVVNYRDKYLQLKQRFKESVDVAFRLGFEQGAQASQMQQMQDQQQQIADQQAQEAKMQANGFGQEGQEDSDNHDENGAQIQDDSRGVGQQTQGTGGMNAGSSQLDQHIGELEGLMSKTEYGTENWEVLKKSLDNLKSIKVSLDLKKNETLIKSISVNLNKRKPLVLNPNAKHNLNQHAKNALSLQHKIINDVMDLWDKEEKGLPKDIADAIKVENSK